MEESAYSKNRVYYSASEKHIMMFFIEIYNLIYEFLLLETNKQKRLKRQNSSTSKILFGFFVLKTDFYPIFIDSDLFKGILFMKHKLEQFIQIFLMLSIFIIENNLCFFAYF